MKKTIKIFKSIDELSQYFAEQLAQSISNTPEGNFFSIALSGGSTPRLVFQYLALNFKDKIDWRKLLVFWSDERCVAPESDESNFRMAKESFLDQVPIPPINIFRIIGEADSFDEAARYSGVVRKQVPSKNNILQFDLVMLGLGDDGHTASIFPGNLHLFNSEKIFEVVQHPQTKQKRITITGNLINQALTVAFIVTGDSKATMIANVLEKQEDWENLPASLVHPENGNLLWLLDNNAAAKLTYSTKHYEGK